MEGETKEGTKNKFDFAVLGASGMQGTIVARDLIEAGFCIALSDIYGEGSLELLKNFPGCGTYERVDVRDEKNLAKYLTRLGKPIVINCAEGDWNLGVYKAALKAGCHIIDLGSDIPVTVEQLGLDEEFRAKDLTAITGCGSTPGINNVMFRYAADKLGEIESAELGFVWDSNIKQYVNPFSIPSIIEEFTLPAPYVENGKWFRSDPMDTIERRKFRSIGEQKVFLVGNHAETYTFFLYYRKRGLKSVRFYAGFPEHSFRTIKIFIDTGFANPKPVEIGGSMTKPTEALAQVLRHLQAPQGYTERENLWVHVRKPGNEDPAPDIVMECIVDTLPNWEDAGCNIDTGLPASFIAQFIKSGLISERGSFEPGAVVPVKPFFEAIATRGMRIYENGKLLDLKQLAGIEYPPLKLPNRPAAQPTFAPDTAD